MSLALPSVALIGFGEVGGILAQELRAQNITVCAFDPQASLAMAEKAAACGAHFASTLVQALEGATLVFSAVTAANTLAVALQCAPLLRPGQTFLDLNSAAPNTKRAAAEAISTSGAVYVEVAVMAPVPPKRLKTPLLLGGEGAVTIAAQLNALGFNSQVYSPHIGEASAIKMCRSVMIKGLEALTAECLLAAQRYGVEQPVLDSLHASFPSLGWDQQLPHYLISRIAEHGKRRAEEMREVVQTLRDVGIEPHQSLATVASQQGLVDAMSAQRLAYSELTPFVWQTALSKIYPAGD
ncbi:NAD(P)-dependent oxidoreductase [Serratia quinivorans]|uniref:NAD(P)-dependent oxidoreductase n=1 Tax=Serratia quinivorans TaxID=137545 RepID=UPI002179BFDE|nr:DUF1932 domain-containing protein [Serratia quinivorans]CAI0747002.1 6-phosphogluconate dehydrogenase-like protein [Serratia quinivorans]CAI1563073.1 6-phosphogluconate dehydrogenase-like protein [Serratia quinivorans]CAI1868387.1 6-phosphogluconate dehydrogenase-like protein [Serratia quinivorans]